MADTDTIDPWAGVKRASNVFTWLFGAVSLISLISDLDLIALESQLWSWINAYKARVEWLGDLLFGWVDFWWMDISPTEFHALVIILIVARATWRALDAVDPDPVVSFVLTLLTYLFFVVVAALVPEPFSLWVLLIVPAVVTLVAISDGSSDRARLERNLFIADIVFSAMAAGAIVITDRIFTQVF